MRIPERLDRAVAGMTCREVLLALPDFLDGGLPKAHVAQVRAHLAGCRECERFGGVVGALSPLVRREPGAPGPQAPGVARVPRERPHAACGAAEWHRCRQ